MDKEKIKELLSIIAKKVDAKVIEEGGVVTIEIISLDSRNILSTISEIRRRISRNIRIHLKENFIYDTNVTPNLENICFHERVDFSNASFATSVQLSNNVFKKKVSFRKSTFNSNVRFHNTIFEEEVDFENTTFRKLCDFIEQSFLKIKGFI